MYILYIQTRHGKRYLKNVQVSTIPVTYDFTFVRGDAYVFNSELSIRIIMDSNPNIEFEFK